MLSFTPDQQLALDFPGNVIVSAGAGSGKTHILVEKYFRLLVDAHPTWPVESVVAITFTRKAAAELQTRIIRRLTQELEKLALPPDRMARVLQVRADLGAAPIGTIHTFCGRILREFAFDARLNPDFGIVEGARETTLRLDAARQAMAAATADAGGADYQALLQILNVMSPIALENVLSGMIAGRSNFLRPARKYLELTTDELFVELQSLHADYVRQLYEEISAEWLPLLDYLVRVCQPGTVQAAAAAAQEALTACADDEREACRLALDNFVELALTKTGTCRKAEFKKAGIDDFDEVRASIEAAAGRFKKAVLEDLGAEDRRDLELTRHLARLFQKAVEIYGQLRGGGESDDEVQLLDYADLEVLTEKMLAERPRLARLLQERYRYLIIDEFQDTSEQQWNILKALCLDENGEALPDRLFVVGDRKQGVYGFRDANVQLFAHVQEIITTANPEWEGGRGAVSMMANFRTSAVPLDTINRVFEKVLNSVESRWAVEFDALTLTRKDDGGCVEYLYVPAPESEDGKTVRVTAQQQRDNEAALVAAHIARAVANGKRPGDIAILTRRRSVFTPFEEALQARGIPVITQQGLNMFHQPELADALAALNSVVYPHRDLVFVHYLRSPGIGFTDDLLLKISRTPGRSYYEKAVRVCSDGKFRLDDAWYPLTPDELERLNFALDTLRTARHMVGLESPYEVCRYVIETLGLRLIARSTWRGEQAVLNLQRLLDMARSAEFLSYEDFLQYVQSEENTDRGTGEIVDLSNADAVRIMTIHAAKGLEFPTVYLPDLNSGVGGRLDTVDGDGENWMTLRLPPEMRSETPVFLSEYFRKRDDEQSMAEERRVFYVAMTRCEQHLVLCASEGKVAGKNRFYEMIEPEFSDARANSNLMTPDDFSDEELYPETTVDYEMPAEEKMGRDSRVAAALHAARILTEIHEA